MLAASVEGSNRPAMITSGQCFEVGILIAFISHMVHDIKLHCHVKCFTFKHILILAK
jgi:hypothetical protein